MAEVQVISVPVIWVDDNEKRLDASFYAQDVISARVLLDKLKRKGIPLESLGNLSSSIFHRTRFKRKYVAAREGYPFLTPTDIFMFSFKPRKYVIDPPEGLQVDRNWILITCSGTVGRCIISNKLFLKCILSHDIIRLVPNCNDILGYIYAYLNTWMGQAFLSKDRYGATIKHIEPGHVANISLPLLPEYYVKEINEKILNAHRLREEAQELLVEAEKTFYEELELPPLDDDVVEYLNGKECKLIKAFTLASNELLTARIRLNAYSYLPICRYARKILAESKGKFDLKKLGDSKVSKKVFTPPRFKRIYVKNENNGIPLLQGSHIPLLKYFDIKLIWNKMENLKEYLIKRNWILVTCSGTVGKVFLVSKFCEGWAATNHMTRILPYEKVNAGYLTIFLQSLYGFSQLQTLIYGGVVEELGEAGELLGEILVPIPSDSTQEKIGNLVIEAYEKKDQANMLENEAVKALEEKLMEAAK
jgi:type I restriction enzyme S subunit